MPFKPDLAEKYLQQQIINLAKVRGWLVYHTHDSRHSEKGFPDLFLVRRGEFVVIECKTQTGKTTSEQDGWLIELSAIPGCRWAAVVRPDDWYAGVVDPWLQ